MLEVVSVSLGSVSRDTDQVVTILDRQVHVRRVGVGGDLRRARDLIRELDGKVDAFGLGGIDLYVAVRGRRYYFRQALELARAAKRLGDAGVETTQVLLEGDPTEHLVNYARQHHSDLVLIVSGPQHGALGASSGELLWRSYLTTLLLRPGHAAEVETPHRAARVLVALDGSKRAECVLPWVQMLAERAGEGAVDIFLAHVVTEPELPRLTPPTDEDLKLVARLVERNREEATAYLESARARLGVPAHTRLLQGRKVASVLHDLVEEENMDVVVLSAHGYGGESRWPFGDVATSFIDYGRTPLLLVQDMPKHEPATVAVTAESWGG